MLPVLHVIYFQFTNNLPAPLLSLNRLCSPLCPPYKPCSLSFSLLPPPFMFSVSSLFPFHLICPYILFLILCPLYFLHLLSSVFFIFPSSSFCLLHPPFLNHSFSSPLPCHSLSSPSIFSLFLIHAPLVPFWHFFLHTSKFPNPSSLSPLLNLTLLMKSSFFYTSVSLFSSAHPCFSSFLLPFAGFCPSHFYFLPSPLTLPLSLIFK
jgi:hypothetical protein